jgi:hypothetical protein
MEMNTPTENVMGPNPAKTDGEIRPHNLLQLVTSNDYVELFWFPGSGFDGELWVKKFNRTTEPEGNVPLRPDGWVDKIAHFIMDWTAAHPVAWDIVLPMPWNTIRDRNAAIMATKGFVANAPRVLFYADQAFPVLDLELAIPIPATSDGSWDIRNVVRAWWEIMNYAYKYQGSHPVTCCAHARFTRSSNSLLSPAYSANPDDRVCWIEFLSAYPKSENRSQSAQGSHAALPADVQPVGAALDRAIWRTPPLRQVLARRSWHRSQTALSGGEPDAIQPSTPAARSRRHLPQHLPEKDAALRQLRKFWPSGNQQQLAGGDAAFHVRVGLGSIR